MIGSFFARNNKKHAPSPRLPIAIGHQYPTTMFNNKGWLSTDLRAAHKNNKKMDLPSYPEIHVARQTSVLYLKNLFNIIGLSSIGKKLRESLNTYFRFNKCSIKFPKKSILTKIISSDRKLEQHSTEKRSCYLKRYGNLIFSKVFRQFTPLIKLEM